MTGTLRVLLEIGPKGRRVVAAATDWPGLDRWGNTEDEALAKFRIAHHVMDHAWEMEDRSG